MFSCFVLTLMRHFSRLFNVSSTKAKNGKNRIAILTIFRHLRRAERGANGYIELTFFLS